MFPKRRKREKKKREEKRKKEKEKKKKEKGKNWAPQGPFLDPRRRPPRPPFVPGSSRVSVPVLV